MLLMALLSSLLSVSLSSPSTPHHLLSASRFYSLPCFPIPCSVIFIFIHSVLLSSSFSFPSHPFLVLVFLFLFLFPFYSVFIPVFHFHLCLLFLLTSSFPFFMPILFSYCHYSRAFPPSAPFPFPHLFAITAFVLSFLPPIFLPTYTQACVCLPSFLHLRDPSPGKKWPSGIKMSRFLLRLSSPGKVFGLSFQPSRRGWEECMKLLKQG